MKWLVTYVEYDDQPDGKVLLTGMKYNVSKTVDGDTTELNGVFNIDNSDKTKQTVTTLADLQALPEQQLVQLLHRVMGPAKVRQTEGMLDLAIRHAQPQHNGFVPAELNGE